MLHKEITEKIIGAAMQVHRGLGNGFPEYFYQRALAIEFGILNITFEREKEMTVVYKGEQIGKRRVNFLWKVK